MGVQKKEKRRINYDLMFGTKPDEPRKMGGTPANANSDLNKIPNYALLRI